MPTSYLFQLNLDLSDRKTEPHFDADFPSYSWAKTDSTFIENCIPTGFFKLEDCFNNLLSGKSDVLDEDCRIRNQLDHQQFIPVQLIATLQRNETGEALYFQCGITVLEKPNEEIESETINSLFKYNPQSFCYLGLNGEVIRVNKRLCEFVNIPESALLQRSFSDFLQPKDLADAEQIFKKAKEGRANQYEFTIYLHNDIEKRVRINIFPRFKNGKVIGVYGIFEDITETVETLHRWKELVEQNPLPVLIFIDRKFVFTNSAAAGFYDVADVRELIGMSVMDFCPPEEQERLKQREKRILANGKIEPAESLIQTKTGITRYIIANACRVTYNGREAIQSVIYDITEIKKQKEIIEKSLREKETLLTEIHHRVKNNLAIISGLLELQIQTIKDEGTIEVLRDSQNRIHSIALVHQQLYQFESFDEINLDVYLSDLFEGLRNTLDSLKPVRFNIDSDQIKISIEHAIPCSLILNEVVINAFKHAFDGISDPELEIRVKQKNNTIELMVCDNGVGIEKKGTDLTKPSLGSTLINILTEQLEGTSGYEQGETKGTCFKLTFPIT